MLRYSPEARLASPRDRAQCLAAIKTGSRTFYAASLVLPPSVREPAYGLYAFCRLSDDAIDLGGGSLAALDRLRERLERAFAGRPLDHAADRAFADFLAHFCVPRELPEALLEGLAWDAEGRRYETLEDLHAYAARVAGAVGAMMTLMMGARQRATLARACDLGVAMQLTNIARDIGEDARAGRIYLPLQWMRDAGLEPRRLLAEPKLSAPLQAVVARLLREADALYARARSGVADLPWECRPAILAGGIALCRSRTRSGTRRPGFDQPARPGPGRPQTAVARAIDRGDAVDRRRRPGPSAGGVEFLVEAVAAAPVPARAIATPSRTAGPQLGRMVDMFARLERADQIGS